MTKRKYPAISLHPTLHGYLEIDWENDYDGSFHCPECGSNQLGFYRREGRICQLNVKCSNCLQDICLTCQTGRHIFHYQSGVICPNPLCNKLAPDEKTKGWVYLSQVKERRYKCYYCGISFTYGKESNQAWSNRQKIKSIQPFRFEDNIWDLRNFYECWQNKTISFFTIEPDWYREQVKRYVHYLLKSRVYRSATSVYSQNIAVKQFGEIVQEHCLKECIDISRTTILAFLDARNQDQPSNLKHKLSFLINFFDWLGLDTTELIRKRDFPKRLFSDSNWLDENVRTAIRQHLDKLPAPIIRHYEVQEYTAARPIDVCRMTKNCLVEDNGKWYIRFYQQKVARWHQLPANRQIRYVIEEQQQWIQQTLGEDYPYLFCHFRGICARSYPEFPGLKPLPEPPAIKAHKNQMIRIIRLLIKQENILDTNGQPPHFTGKITRHSRLQEIRTKYGMKAAQLYADHTNSRTTFQHYSPPTQEQVAEVDLPFQALLMNPDNRFLPWQSLSESLLKNPKAHELDIEIAPRLVVYGHCTLNPKTPCPHNLYPKCYGCSSFRPSTGKLPLYERQYVGEQQRMQQAKDGEVELAYEEAKTTVEAMDKWLPGLRRLAND